MVGSNQVLAGKMQLLNVLVTNKNVEYEVQIVGVLSTLFQNIGELPLNAIDLSEFNHTRNQTNIKASWDYDIILNGSLSNFAKPGLGYVYPYIVKGNNLKITDYIYTDESFPSVYVKTIIDKIINNAGFTYSSTFFESDYYKKLIIPFNGEKIQINSEEAEELKTIVGINALGLYVYPLGQVKRGEGWNYTSARNYKLPFDRELGTVTNEGEDLTFTDSNNQWINTSTQNFLICKKAGRYNINYVAKMFPVAHRTDECNFEFKSGLIQYRYQMLLLKANGTTIELNSSRNLNDSNDVFGVKTFQFSSGVNNGPTWIDYGNLDLQHTMIANDIYMDIDDRVVIRYGLNAPGDVKWKGNCLDRNVTYSLAIERSFGATSTDAYSRVEFSKADNNISPISEIDMNAILDSSIKQKDFLLDIVKMFNLVIADNPVKEFDLIIEPYDDFYKSKQKVLNWDDERKLDNDSLVKLTPMSEMEGKVYRYTYTSDNDFYNKEYTLDTKGRIMGDYQESVINDFSDKTVETKVGFSPTVNSSVDINGRVAPFFVNYTNEEYSPRKSKMRILFYGGLVDCAPYILKDTGGSEDSSGSALTSYPYCGMWDNPTNGVYSLEFGRADKFYFQSSIIPNQTLFEKFHKTTLNQIKDVNAKLMECTVKLTPADVAQFDFRDIIFLNGTYWRMNEIKDFNPINSDKLTTVILYKIIDIDIIGKFQVVVPTSNSSCPTDIRIKQVSPGRFIYTSTSGLFVSSDCCAQVGGVYVNGICRASTTPPVLPPLGPWETPTDGYPWFGEPWGGIRPYNPNPFPWTGRVRNQIGGTWRIPTEERFGPEVFKKYNTSRNNLTKTFGEYNYVRPQSKINLIVGSFSSPAINVENSLIIGNNVQATESNSIFLKNAKILSDGTIKSIGTKIIDGGLNTVFPFWRTNRTAIIDGTIDSVRNPNGTFSDRPIIDGNPYE